MKGEKNNEEPNRKKITRQQESDPVCKVLFYARNNNSVTLNEIFRWFCINAAAKAGFAWEQIWIAR